MKNGSCLWWDKSGIPCKHTIYYISYKKANVKDYCHEYFTVEKKLACYKPLLHYFSQNEVEEYNILANEKLLPHIVKGNLVDQKWLKRNRRRNTNRW